MVERTVRENRSAAVPHLESVMVRPWERRMQPRFRQREAARKYNMDCIDVRITTMERRYGATLVDLSTGGAGVLLAMPLPVNSPVGVELQIGQYTIAAFGQVKSVMQKGNQYRMGVQFVHLDAAELEFLRLLEAPARHVRA